MMADDLSRTLGKLEATLDLLREDFRKLDHTMKNLQQGLQATAALPGRIDALEERVKKLEGGSGWFLKAVGGVLVGAILALIIKSGVPLPK